MYYASVYRVPRLHRQQRPRSDRSAAASASAIDFPPPLIYLSGSVLRLQRGVVGVFCPSFSSLTPKSSQQQPSVDLIPCISARCHIGVLRGVHHKSENCVVHDTPEAATREKKRSDMRPGSQRTQQISKRSERAKFSTAIVQLMAIKWRRSNRVPRAHPPRGSVCSHSP